MNDLTASEREQIAEILTRRAREVASFSDEYRRDGKHFGSVEFALTREIDRLRRLAERVNPPAAEEDPLTQAVEAILEDGHMNCEHLARLRAAFEAR